MTGPTPARDIEPGAVIDLNPLFSESDDQYRQHTYSRWNVVEVTHVTVDVLEATITYRAPSGSAARVTVPPGKSLMVVGQGVPAGDALTREGEDGAPEPPSPSSPARTSPAGRPRGIQGPTVEPGSPEWLRTLSASKVSTVLGLNPWDSAFNLYWLMRGEITKPAQSDEQSRGHDMEPMLARRWERLHPEYHVARGGTWTHAEHPWATASPDRLLYDAKTVGLGPSQPVALAELKSSAMWWDWGTPGTDEVPVYVRAQCLWQMWVTGIDVTHVAMIGMGLEFAEYVVHYDADEMATIVERCEEFMANLAAGIPPDIDAHESTTYALKELHPDIADGTETELGDELGRFFVLAEQNFKAAEEAKGLARNLVLDHMGDARRALWRGQWVARRQANTNRAPGEVGRPFLVASPKLPDIDTKEDAA